MATTAAMEKQ